MKLISIIASVCLGIILFAPAFKVRFGLNDALVYYLPALIMLGCVVLSNIFNLQGLVPRFIAASIFFIMYASPLFAFFRGGSADSVLIFIILLNLSIGMLVVLFPWNTDSLNMLLRVFSIFGALLALNTLLFFSTDDLISEATDETSGYLVVALAMGTGTIVALYFVLKNFSILSMSIFAMSWMGLVVGRGRGAVLFCVLVSVLYLFTVLNTKLATLNKAKKFLILLLVASFVPIAVTQASKVTRTSEGLMRILTETDVEAEEGGRGELWSNAIERIGESPLIGHGLGQYDTMLTGGGHPHNIFLQYGVDSGLLGMLLLGLFCLIVLWKIWRSFRISTPETVNLVYVIAAIFCYCLLNYSKSGDAYIGRDIFIISALPIALHLVMVKTKLARGRRRRSRKKLIRMMQERPHLSGEAASKSAL